MSLARKHKARTQLNSKPDKASSPVVNHATSEAKAQGPLPEALQKLKDGFNGDRQSLKLLNGDQQRDPFKLELIEKYRPLCEHFMKNFNDWARLDCLFWWLMWRSDVEDFTAVEPDLYKAVQCGLTAPIKGFERDWQTLYCDLVYLYCDANLKAAKEEGKEWNTFPLCKVVTDITNGDIILNVPLKAKIYAIYGKVAMRLENTEIAAKAFKMALALNDKVGVKKLLAECEEMLEPAQTTENETGDSEQGEDK